MTIAVDFDGTCVTHEYPKVGKDIGAAEVLRDIVASGHKLILWTIRSDKELNAAVQWFADRRIPLYGANDNASQREWNGSRKVDANLYIDDAALGCPLAEDRAQGVITRSYVDWDAVRSMLVSRGVITVPPEPKEKP